MRPYATGHLARRGTLLVVVLGLITIFLALMLAITVRVYNSTKSGTSLQQNVQAYLMLQTSKLLIQRYYEASKLLPLTASGVPTGSVTAGDNWSTSPGIPNRPYGDELGWVHLKDAAVPAGPWTHQFDVIAAGGSSAQGAAKTSVASTLPGQEVRGAYEIRYHYNVLYNSAATGTTPKFQITVLTAADNTTYPW